jgi:hypothetical protein
MSLLRRRPTSSRAYARADVLLAIARAQSQAELALHELRVAKLKAAAEFERLGDHDEARRLIEQVRVAQEADEEQDDDEHDLH